MNNKCRVLLAFGIIIIIIIIIIERKKELRPGTCRIHASKFYRLMCPNIHG
jgi:hypothetical protein